MRKREWPRNTS